MKLWRKSGYKNLSGRLRGAAREKVYVSYPSPLLITLVNRLAPKQTQLVGQSITVGN